jgi:hypothetical protein
VGDLSAEEVLSLGGRSTLVPLRGGFDAVAFISEPDSMISPSEGVDRDLERFRDAILPTVTLSKFEYHRLVKLVSFLIPFLSSSCCNSYTFLQSAFGGGFNEKVSVSSSFREQNDSLGMFESPTGLIGLPSHQSLVAEIIPGTSLGQKQGFEWDGRWKQ